MPTPLLLRKRLNNPPPHPRPLRTLATTLLATARKTARAMNEANSLVIEHVPVYIRQLPRIFDGFRIVQLTDIHHSPQTSRQHIENAVVMANGLRPDLTVLTGDYVSHEREYAAPCAEILAGLRSRCGTYAILGNHDHWTDAPLIIDLFEAEGIKMLVNEGLRFVHPDAEHESFWLAGVDDRMVGLENLPRALAGARTTEPKIVLAHNPLIIRRARREGVDLVLSGHTHGGQVTWHQRQPNPNRYLRRPTRGFSRLGETQIYVSRGIGTSVLPVRYACPPEITLIELRCTE